MMALLVLLMFVMIMGMSTNLMKANDESGMRKLEKSIDHLTNQIATLQQRLDTMIINTNYLYIEIKSWGWDDVTNPYGKVIINGQDYRGKGRGLGIVDIDISGLQSDLYTCDKDGEFSNVQSIEEIDISKYITSKAFDTYQDEQSMHKLLKHLHRIQDGNIVIVCSSDSSKKEDNLDSNIWHYFKNDLGVQFMVKIDYTISFRDSFVLIGRAGAKVEEPWMNIVKKDRYKGPTFYSTRIKVNPICQAN